MSHLIPAVIGSDLSWLAGQSPLYVYLGLFALLMSGVFGFPPEDLTLIIGGIAASRTSARIEIIFLVCYVGTVAGDLLIYLIGRFCAKTLLKLNWVAKRLHPEKIAIVRSNLERRSLLMIFVARHLFYFRTITFLVCGTVRMSLVRFIVTDALAALISVPFMLSIGFWASEHYERIWSDLQSANKWLAFLIAGAALISIRFWYLKRRSRQQVVLKQDASQP